MYSGLTVHTTSTIAAGEAELLTFEKALKVKSLLLSIELSTTYVKIFQEYTQATSNEKKKWNFPKAHTHQHLFQDIVRKGATRNYNTKPSEKANGPLKKYYQRHTNFKNVAKQVRVCFWIAYYDINLWYISINRSLQ